jgi:hypothetical protein
MTVYFSWWLLQVMKVFSACAVLTFYSKKGNSNQSDWISWLTGKTDDGLTIYMMNILHKYKVSHKIVAFCGDNCNTNFCETANDRRSNAFFFYKLAITNLKMNICGIGCTVHILHSALQQLVIFYQLMPRPIVNKVFQYFHVLWHFDFTI